MGDTSEMAAFLELGARVLVVGSDQGWLMSQGRSIRQALDGAAKRAP
jgi:hypothetical protein